MTDNLQSPPASLDSVMQTARSESTKGPPPVHLWDPPFCGDLDMRIARDGTWFYLGTPIGRKPLVKLFSSVLKREGDAYFLVTPVEKIGIRVDDAPFVAVDFDLQGSGLQQRIVFQTNVDEEVTADAQHPIRLSYDEATGEPAPYVLVRRNLEALIDRKSFYRLVDIAEECEIDGELHLSIRSSGEFFPIIPKAALED